MILHRCSYRVFRRENHGVYGAPPGEQDEGIRHGHSCRTAGAGSYGTDHGPCERGICTTRHLLEMLIDESGQELGSAMGGALRICGP